jgi:Family of unknown function (DUF6879)
LGRQVCGQLWASACYLGPLRHVSGISCSCASLHLRDLRLRPSEATGQLICAEPGLETELAQSSGQAGPIAAGFHRSTCPSESPVSRRVVVSLTCPPYRDGVSGYVSRPDAITMSPAAFDDRFDELFERCAFRLELLDRYDSPGTQDRLERFLAGEPDDPAIRAGWDDFLADLRRAGKSISRVHVVSEPLTDYLRFELAFYAGSVAAGEDVRILPRVTGAEMSLPSFDFWLFDDEAAAVMIYDSAGSWQGVQLVTDSEFVSDCRRWREATMRRAMPLTDYIEGRAA